MIVLFLKKINCFAYEFDNNSNRAWNNKEWISFVHSIDTSSISDYPLHINTPDKEERKELVFEPIIFSKNGNPFYDQNDAQHEQIATKYVDQMSLLLEAYAISAGIQSPDPNISLFEYCKDLTWGGLSDTKAYRKYATNKTRIQNHLKSEAKRDVNSTKKKGC